MYRNLFILVLSSMIFAGYEYSKQDLNPTSSSFGDLVWEPTYDGYITLHYFTTQGWAGWTSLFGQLSEFQEKLHSEGYDKVVIIAIGQSAQVNFNSNFCSGSDLPLINDDSSSGLPIHEAFNGEHRSLVVVDSDGSTELYRRILSSTYFPLYEDEFREIIISNYPDDTNPGITGDVNNDDIVNILDVIQVVNIILSGDNSDNADLNSDGIVNVLDIIAVVNIILDR